MSLVFSQTNVIDVAFNVTGKRVILDAGDASTITQSGGNVSKWRDKSGFNNNAIQPTEATRPSYSASTINGLPALSFTSGKNILNTTLSALQSGFTIILVTAQSAIVSGDGAYLFSQGSSTLFLRNDPVVESNKFSTFLKVGESIEPRAQAPMVPVSGTAYIVLAKYDGTTLRTTVYNNGATQSRTRTPAADGLVGFNIYNLNNSTLSVGELIVFKRSLDSTELIMISRYLSNKWGIPIA